MCGGAVAMGTGLSGLVMLAGGATGMDMPLERGGPAMVAASELLGFSFGS